MKKGARGICFMPRQLASPGKSPAPLQHRPTFPRKALAPFFKGGKLTWLR
ncbi:hypothetical protein [Lysobacter gummosus]